MDQETPMQARRRRLGLSLRELAEYTSINRGVLSLWERGRYVPSPDEQARLTGVLQDFSMAMSKRGAAPFLTPEERKQRTTARRLVSVAVRKGELVRQPCEVCDKTPSVAHHRNGYDDPLDVVWLCGMHHGQEHMGMNLERSTEAVAQRQKASRELRHRAMTAYRRNDR